MCSVHCAVGSGQYDMCCVPYLLFLTPDKLEVAPRHTKILSRLTALTYFIAQQGGFLSAQAGVAGVLSADGERVMYYNVLPSI